MNRIDLTKLESALGDMLERPEPERAGAMEELTLRDPELAGAVWRMLAVHERAEGVFTAPEEGLVSEGLDSGPDPLVGSTLGDFTLTRLVGAGGMGRVYEARQRAPSRPVAVKVLASSLLAGAAAQRRFRREAELLGALDHPGICRVLSAGTAPVGAEIVPYIAMELVKGRVLLEAGAELDTRGRIELAARIADAAHFAHSRGIVHRDLKPANILVVKGLDRADPQPKILDFGVSGVITPNAAVSLTVQTEPGQVVGTLAYMSPEQLQGKPADARSDVYAIGLMPSRFSRVARPSRRRRRSWRRRGWRRTGGLHVWARSWRGVRPIWRRWWPALWRPLLRRGIRRERSLRKTCGGCSRSARYLRVGTRSRTARGVSCRGTDGRPWRARLRLAQSPAGWR
jgi:serine/threonine protein kinase